MSTPLIRTVTDRYLKRAGEDTVEPGQEVRAERLIDLINLAVCFDVYAELMESKKETSPLMVKGTVLIKRYMDELNAGVAAHIAPLQDRPDATSLHALFAKALRSGGALVQIRNLAKLFRALLPWLKVRTPVFNGIFTGRSARPARTLAGIYEDSVPASLLNQAATVAPVSGLSATRKWIELVAADAGAPIKPIEGALADTQMAMALGQDLAAVEQQILATPANTPEAAELQAKRVQTLTEIQKVADNSSDPSAVVSAVAAARPTHQYATDIGKKLGHTPEQEVAMMARGRTIIAAGAGSGKTRVLASKVVYHINELGMDPQSILATTFTNKAAAELIARVKKFGGIVENTSGFGTTHAICGKLLNTRATQYRRENYIGKKEGWKQVTLLRLAMEQVKMQGAASPPPKPRGFWEGMAAVEQPMADPDFMGAVQDALGYFQWAAQSWGKPWNNRPGNPKAAAWAADMVQFLREMSRKNPTQLTDQQKRLLNELFSKVKGRTTIFYRVKTGAEATAPTPRKRQNKMEQYEFAKVSARQWFNLGLKLTRQVKNAEVPIPLGEFKNALAIMKGRGMTPSEAWAKGVEEEGEVVYMPESEFAAVYGAYEWLKGSQGETDFRNTGDMDDILIDTVTALVSSPVIRRQLQNQYKVLLIDEAQDLNRVQHLLFGLMAGYLDPQTLQPRPDKSMTADTFALIGDDKQAIYEFRGADPGEFIDKSDLVPGGDNFSTKLLDTNFRSGSSIVNAANKLIAHNKKQVPMVCRAVEDKNGTGKIVARSMDSTEDAAANVAEEIANFVDTGEVSKYDSKEMRGGYASFGIALRSNAEAYAYGVELLKKGVPFKSNANFFSDPNTKALIGWMTIAENGLDGPPDLIEEALQDGAKAPYSKMGPAFVSAMNDKASGSWARWLVDNGANRIYARSEMIDALNHFIANITMVASLTGSPNQILERILQMKGLDGETMEQSMVHTVEENEDLMASLEAEAEDGVVTPEMIREQAMAPLKPLIGLMQGKEDLGSAMSYVRKLRNVNSKIASKDTDEEIDRDAVTIGTMHSWKGLEIPTMYIPVVGGKFPRLTSSQRSLASERRLAYVAITRAEQRAVLFDIPHPKMTDNGRPIRSQFFDEACIPREGSKANKVVPGKTASMEWVESPHTIFEGGKMSQWDDAACMAAMMKINEMDLESMWGQR